MGNQSCYLLGQDCFSYCFSNRYFSWKGDLDNPQSNVKNVDEYPRSSVGDLTRRNRISEYIAQALSRSRSPLLLHDDYLPSNSSPLDPDFPATNTTSWMSDATRSDASHRLYREVDPSFNIRLSTAVGLTDSSYQLATSTSGDDDEQGEVNDGEVSAGGAWVAVARLSGSNKRTSTSAMYLASSGAPAPLVLRRPRPPGLAHPLAVRVGEEEVDSLELARVSRGLWPGGQQQLIRPGSSSATVTNSAEEGSRRARPRPVVRPSVLSLSQRSGSGLGHQACPSYYRQQSLLQYTSMALDPSVLNGGDDSPVELDWDHEPGTASAVGQPGNRSGTRKSRLHLSGSSYLSSSRDEVDMSDAAFVYRRPPIRLDVNGTISGLSHKSAGQYRRSSTGEGVDLGIHKVTYKAAGTTEANDLPDELVDSGFVGLMNTSFYGDCGGGDGADSEVNPGLVAG